MFRRGQIQKAHFAAIPNFSSELSVWEKDYKRQEVATLREGCFEFK